MIVIIALVLGVGDRSGHGFPGANPLPAFAVAILAFLPGWLYSRFIAYRAGTLWDEYVLNLHRLGVDELAHLPKPPVNSAPYERWRVAARGQSKPTIYQAKFDACFGKNISCRKSDDCAWVHAETMFPVCLATAVFAVAWMVVLGEGRLLHSPTDVADTAAFGFVGAYLFVVQMLVRRFYQNDLKASAYTSAVVRIITVVALVVVIHQLPVFTSGNSRQEAVVAFIIGFFPLVGMQVLQRLTAVTLRSVVPTLRADYPLSDLDGLNIWYEARLLEEGIEDMQNLITANLVDVILHTRVPVGRLVDWVDQAHLYLRLERPTRWSERRRDGRRRAESNEAVSSHSSREVLRQLGVRNATSLLELFREATSDAPGRPPSVCDEALAWAAHPTPGLSPARIRALAHLLDREKALEYVEHWRADSCPACRPPETAPGAAVEEHLPPDPLDVPSHEGVGASLALTSSSPRPGQPRQTRRRAGCPNGARNGWPGRRHRLSRWRSAAAWPFSGYVRPACCELRVSNRQRLVLWSVPRHRDRSISPAAGSATRGITMRYRNRLLHVMLAMAIPMLGLAAGVGATAASAPTASALCSSTHTGDWHNINSVTRSITRVNVRMTECGDTVLCDTNGNCRSSQTTFAIHLWGACSPTDCDWQTVTATDAGGGWIRGTYYFGFKTSTVWLRPYVYGSTTYLRVWVYNDFASWDGRADYATDEWHIR